MQMKTAAVLLSAHIATWHLIGRFGDLVVEIEYILMYSNAKLELMMQTNHYVFKFTYVRCLTATPILCIMI
jgi:hypothetical protein